MNGVLGRLMGLVFALLLVMTIVHAEPIDIYHINFDIDKTTKVEQDFIFLNPVNQIIPISIPNDAKELYVFKDGVLINPIISRNEITQELSQNKELKISYTTKEFVDNGKFLVTLNMPYDVRKLIVNMKLPQGYILSKPIIKDTIAGSSVYPSPDELKTDGQSIILNWDFDGISKGQEIAFFVEYEKKTPIFWIVFLAISIFIILGLISYVLFKKPKTREIIREKEVIKEIIKKEYTNIDKHLKEDEAQILQILKDREGHIEQGTLRIITGFSKAKLSGLLKELEDRKIIHKEQRGKKNLVFLKRQ